MLAILIARRNRSQAWLTFVLACATAGMACGSSSNPSGPNPPASGGGATGSCRTYPTAADVTTTSTGAPTQNAKLTGAFNTSTNQSTVMTLFVNGTLCTTTVNSYRSPADFVDEVRVIPGVLMQTATTTTSAPACGGGTGNVSYAYDSQRRLTSFTTSSAGITAGTTTYTAWDSSGRPTTGTMTAGGSTTSISFVYDNAARTVTGTTMTAGGVRTVSVQTFDANGNQARVETTSGANVTTTIYSIMSTDRVCK